jgi:hypothetical protein
VKNASPLSPINAPFPCCHTPHILIYTPYKFVTDRAASLGRHEKESHAHSGEEEERPGGVAGEQEAVAAHGAEDAQGAEEDRSGRPGRRCGRAAPADG